jgi:hypothetical protein
LTKIHSAMWFVSRPQNPSSSQAGSLNDQRRALDGLAAQMTVLQQCVLAFEARSRKIGIVGVENYERVLSGCALCKS